MLWLGVALGCALLWFLTLRGIPDVLTGFTPFFALGLAVALVFGLPLSFIVPRAAPSLIGAQGSRAVFAGIVVLGALLGALSLTLAIKIPTIPWKAAAPPPEPMVELVTTLPMDFTSEGIFARGASGRLYSYACRPDCAWTAREALPTPPDPDEFWPGKCLAAGPAPREFNFLPPPPAPVIMVLPTTFCGIESSFTTYYLLTQDGALWEWGYANWGYGMITFFLCAYPFFFLVGGAVALAWTSRYG